MEATDMSLPLLVAFLTLLCFTKDTEMWNTLISEIRNQEIRKDNNWCQHTQKRSKTRPKSTPKLRTWEHSWTETPKSRRRC